MDKRLKFKVEIASYFKNKYNDTVNESYLAGAISGAEYERKVLLNEIFDWYDRNVLSSNYTPTLNDLRNDFKLDE